MATSFDFFRVEQLLRPHAIEDCDCASTANLCEQTELQGSVPYLRHRPFAMGRAAAARPHDLGGYCLTPERTSVCFAVFPEINAANMPRTGRNLLNKSRTYLKIARRSRSAINVG